MRTFPWGNAIRNLLILGSILLIFLAYVSGDISSLSLRDESPIVLGLSVVEQDITVLLNQLYSNDPLAYSNVIKNDWITSFLLQSPDAAASIYLDYFVIPENIEIPNELCFNSITIAKSGAIPFELVLDQIAPIGLKIENNRYIYDFPDDRRCVVQKGNKYIMPHVLLGIVNVNSYVDLFPYIKGYKASDYFPLDHQEINLDLSINLSQGESNSVIFPSLEVVIAQKGWEGNFSIAPSGQPVLNLKRPELYRAGLVVFFLVMMVLIPFLYDVVDEPGVFLKLLLR